MRKAVVVSMLALTLSIPAAPALAASGHGHHAPAVSKEGHAKPGKGVRTRFTLGGRLVSADDAGSTVTVRVQGGKDKALRRQQVTVTVSSTAVVRRNGAVVALTDLVAGDHVRVSGLRTGTTYAASRVVAEGVAVPTPTDSPTPAPAPTPTGTGTESPA